MLLKTAVIIAGGKGTRLEERTEDLPKPLIPVHGKPLLERVIEWLRKNGVKNVVIGVAYKKEMVKDYFGNGESLGVNIIYTEHDQNGGTEHAFKTAIEKSGIEDENFYAMNCDQITDLQLEGMTNFHLNNNSIVTILTVDLRTNFGIVYKDDQHKVIRFKEKGELPGVPINSGIYIFNKEIKRFLEDGNIEENAFRKLIHEGKIYAFHYGGIWSTVNDKKELEKLEKFLKRFDALVS